jgi:hypothetical protein
MIDDLFDSKKMTVEKLRQLDLLHKESFFSRQKHEFAFSNFIFRAIKIIIITLINAFVKKILSTLDFTSKKFIIINDIMNDIIDDIIDDITDDIINDITDEIIDETDITNKIDITDEIIDETDITKKVDITDDIIDDITDDIIDGIIDEIDTTKETEITDDIIDDTTDDIIDDITDDIIDDITDDIIDEIDITRRTEIIDDILTTSLTTSSAKLRKKLTLRTKLTILILILSADDLIHTMKKIVTVAILTSREKLI